MNLRGITVTEIDGEITSVNVSKESGDSSANIRLSIGEEYIILPLNPAIRRNRGRIVIPYHFFINEDKNVVAKIKFKDNNRHGKIDVRDLGAI